MRSSTILSSKLYLCGDDLPKYQFQIFQPNRVYELFGFELNGSWRKVQNNKGWLAFQCYLLTICY